MKNFLKSLFCRKPNPDVEAVEAANTLVEIANYNIRALQSGLALLQAQLEKERDEARSVVAALTLSHGGEMVLDHQFLEAAKDGLTLKVERANEEGTATRYTLVKTEAKSE